MIKAVGETLESERKRKGLSMHELQEISGVSKGIICYLEKGKRDVTLGTLIRLAPCLGMSVLQIIERSSEP